MLTKSKIPAKQSDNCLHTRIAQLEKEAAGFKQAEARIKRLNAVLTSIRDVNRLIAKEKSRERLITGVCETLVENRGYHNAWIVLVSESSQVFSSGYALMGENVMPIIEQIEGGHPTYCYQRVMDSPEILALKDPSVACADCPMAHIYDGRGAMSIRLEHDGKVFGMFTVSVPAEFAFDREEQILFRDVAGDIAFALHGIEAEERRKQAEERLLKAHDKLEQRVKERTQELKHLYSSLLSTQEEERKRIAADLHDGIGQFLSAIKFMVETALEQTSEGKAPDINSLKGLIPILQDASEEVRTIVMNLRPSILDDLGIIATIGWFCRQLRTVYAALCIKEQIDIREIDVPENLKIILFRILQEAMNNVVKHSGADFVTLKLRKAGGRIVLSVKDNGRGFNVKRLANEASSEKGFGITGMKERTELSGGAFAVESMPGGGCCISATWPVDKIRPI